MDLSDLQLAGLLAAAKGIVDSAAEHLSDDTFTRQRLVEASHTIKALTDYTASQKDAAFKIEPKESARQPHHDEGLRAEVERLRAAEAHAQAEGRKHQEEAETLRRRMGEAEAILMNLLNRMASR